MKSAKIIMMGLAGALCLGAVASQPAKKSKKKAATTVVAPAEPEAVAAEAFSYAVGVAQSPSLKQFIEQREGVDSVHFADFVDGLNGKYSADDIAKFRAIVAGQNIAEQNEKQVVPAINKQATGSETEEYLVKDLFVKGLVEGLTGTNELSVDSCMKIAEQQFKYQEFQAKKKNADYLAEYAKQDGVKKTESGLLYKVLTQGEGVCPTDTDKVEVHYEGKLIDGTEFDSSYKRGKSTTFGVTQVIKGWTEALKLMPVGSTYELCIPYDLAYGERGNRNIPPYSTLIFKVELISIPEK